MGMDLETSVKRFVSEVTDASGGAVASIVLYGSAAVGQHVPGKSDLNFLVVADGLDLSLLRSLQTQMGGWSKRRISTPILVDRDFLVRSTDSYPLEILGMIASKRVLFGSDPLEGLLPKAAGVRVQVEREAKGKELLLRRGYMESRGRQRVLTGYLVGVLPSIEAILRGILYTRGGDWKRHGAQLVAEAESRLGIDLSALREIRAIRYGRGKPAHAKVDALYGRTLDLITALADRADRDGEDQ